MPSGSLGGSGPPLSPVPAEPCRRPGPKPRLCAPDQIIAADTATAEDIRLFQLHLSEAGVSICNRNRIMTGLRFLFRVTLRRLDLAAEIYHIREPQKIALVMSPDETRRLLAVANTLKVRILLSLGCGLRAGEVGPAEGQAYRQRAEDHSHRAVQEPQGSQCHAIG